MISIIPLLLLREILHPYPKLAALRSKYSASAVCDQIVIAAWNVKTKTLHHHKPNVYYTVPLWRVKRMSAFQGFDRLEDFSTFAIFL